MPRYGRGETENASARIIARTIAAVIVFGITAIITNRCSTGAARDRAEAKTPLALVDVASAGYDSGDSSISYETESFWLDKATQSLTRCLHKNYNQGLTSEATSCEAFPQPSQLSNPTLLAINKGVYQKAASVWLSQGQMFLCEHDQTLLSGLIKPAKTCQPFQKPQEIKSDAILTAINSGSGQDAQSFWINTDSTLTQCTHEKTGAILGILDAKFGAVKNCQAMAIPSDKFPAGLESLTLAGVTSDQDRAAETFWQDKDGVLVRCEHKKEGGDGTFIAQHLGQAKQCNFWKAPVLNR